MAANVLNSPSVIDVRVAMHARILHTVSLNCSDLLVLKLDKTRSLMQLSFGFTVDSSVGAEDERTREEFLPLRVVLSVVLPMRPRDVPFSTGYRERSVSFPVEAIGAEGFKHNKVRIR